MYSVRNLALPRSIKPRLGRVFGKIRQNSLQIAFKLTALSILSKTAHVFIIYVANRCLKSDDH